MEPENPDISLRADRIALLSGGTVGGVDNIAGTGPVVDFLSDEGPDLPSAGSVPRKRLLRLWRQGLTEARDFYRFYLAVYIFLFVLCQIRDPNGPRLVMAFWRNCLFGRRPS